MLRHSVLLHGNLWICCMSVYVYVFDMYMCVCIYIYIHTYIHTHTHTQAHRHIHTYTHHVCVRNANFSLEYKKHTPKKLTPYFPSFCCCSLFSNTA